MPLVTLLDGHTHPVANIFCIGRNYAAHAAELGNAVEPEPVVFLKPTSALLHEGMPLTLPDFSQDVHHEVELVLLIGQGGKCIPRHQALAHVAGYGIGLDLTARDRQGEAKQKGLPWTLSKGFDGSACLSRFLPASAVTHPQALHFHLDVNGVRRQTGDTRLMVYDLGFLIEYLSTRFTLQAGDLIYTGTPAGVAALAPGDVLDLDLNGQLQARFTVAD
jgi:2-keto-4-pentenoate hydratase/2-oxohepta-3-ene-1,7-dioic acid hydratase in catechol pathway